MIRAGHSRYALPEIGPRLLGECARDGGLLRQLVYRVLDGYAAPKSPIGHLGPSVGDTYCRTFAAALLREQRWPRCGVEGPTSRRSGSCSGFDLGMHSYLEMVD